MAGHDAALLWAACRPRPDTAGVRAAIAGGADLARTADIAIAQRVSPLLWRALGEAGVHVNGDAWADRMRADSMRCKARALMVLPRMGEAALAPLADAGLEPLVLKGAVLADRYPAPGLRPMDDVDIALPRDQHPLALQVLQRAGWEKAPPWPGSHHDVVLTHRALPGLPLELHHAFAMWRERVTNLTTDELWERRVPFTFAGGKAFGLAPEDELVAVATHAAKPFHVFSRLLWIVDIAVIIDSAAASGAPLDWGRVEALATAAGGRTALAVALTHAARLGAESPPHLRQPPATPTRMAALEPVLSADWPATDHTWTTRHQLGYALVDGNLKQIQLFIGAVTHDDLKGAPGRAIVFGARAVRRWWRLRRSVRHAAEHRH